MLCARLARSILLLALSLLTIAGCSSGTPQLATVRGKVTYRGTPLHAGTIVFVPDSTRGTRGPLAMAEIQPDGSYSLTAGEAAGAIVGWHRVTVVSVMTLSAANGQRYGTPQTLIPERYRDPDLSGLLREVKSGQANVFEIDLE